MKNYDKLKKIIQEANPEIMELKFGCKTSKGVITSFFESQGNYSYAMTPYSTTWNGITGEATARRYGEDDFKILGRPIRLADVLLAINYFTRNNTNTYCVFSDGDIGKVNEGEIYSKWNLKDDNLDNQSDKTKKFLIELLVK